MSHQGFQVSLGEHGAGQWIAVFYSGRGGHEPVAGAGTAQAPTPWQAVQRAAWQFVNSNPAAAPFVRLILSGSWRSRPVITSTV